MDIPAILSEAVGSFKQKSSPKRQRAIFVATTSFPMWRKNVSEFIHRLVYHLLKRCWLKVATASLFTHNLLL